MFNPSNNNKQQDPASGVIGERSSVRISSSGNILTQAPTSMAAIEPSQEQDNALLTRHLPVTTTRYCKTTSLANQRAPPRDNSLQPHPFLRPPPASGRTPSSSHATPLAVAGCVTRSAWSYSQPHHPQAYDQNNMDFPTSRTSGTSFWNHVPRNSTIHFKLDSITRHNNKKHFSTRENRTRHGRA